MIRHFMMPLLAGALALWSPMAFGADDGGDGASTSVSHSAFGNVFMSGGSSSASPAPGGVSTTVKGGVNTGRSIRSTPPSPGITMSPQPGIQRPVVSHSPFNNVHNIQPPLQTHTSTVTHLNPRPGQWYAAWGNGFVIGGGGHGHGGHGQCCWINGGWTYRTVQVWVPDQTIERVVPAQYDYRVVNGIVQPVKVAEPRLERVFVPGHFEYRRERIWVPGFWLCGHSHHGGAPHGSADFHMKQQASAE